MFWNFSQVALHFHVPLSNTASLQKLGIFSTTLVVILVILRSCVTLSVESETVSLFLSISARRALRGAWQDVMMGAPHHFEMMATGSLDCQASQRLIKGE